MNTNNTTLTGFLSLVCIFSWLFVFASVTSTSQRSPTRDMSGETVWLLCVSSSIPGFFFGLPAVVGVAEVRRTTRKEPRASGYELFGLLCLVTSWAILVGYAMPKYELRGAWWGWLASACFLTTAAQLGFRCLKRMRQKSPKCDATQHAQSAARGSLAIDILNALSLLAQMLTVIPTKIGVFLAGPMIFIASPTEFFGVLAFVVASYWRRSQVPDTILLEILGTLCLMSTSLVFSRFEFAIGLLPFLLATGAKSPYLAVQRARRQPWTRITPYGMSLFLAGCVVLATYTVYACWRGRFW